MRVKGGNKAGPISSRAPEAEAGRRGSPRLTRSAGAEDGSPADHQPPQHRVAPRRDDDEHRRSRPQTPPRRRGRAPTNGHRHRHHLRADHLAELPAEAVSRAVLLDQVRGAVSTVLWQRRRGAVGDTGSGARNVERTAGPACRARRRTPSDRPTCGIRRSRRPPTPARSRGLVGFSVASQQAYSGWFFDPAPRWTEAGTDCGRKAYFICVSSSGATCVEV